MSIPLIQETTKDAINTSIIAIKRNIERINMLLGLVDSGSPDLSGLATKQELEDAVNSLQPVDEVALNNMHSVTSNAVAKANSYVVGQEVKTGGKFFDGTNWKDVYRKEYYATIGNGSRVPLNISNLDRVCKLDGTMWYDAGSNRNYVLQLNNPNDNGYWSRCAIMEGNYLEFILSGWNTVNVYVCVEYTKTTD